MPGASLAQSVPVPRTERVNEHKMNMHPAVDLKGHALMSKHMHASCKYQEIPQAHLFKPLFPVGSYILALTPWNQLGQLLNRSLM